ncbi:hypothetical protein PSH58_24790 [Pseudomonas hefeiensis]|uniref:Uncharacterized protein n=1 Tax=Pseudomonas hefeiensis TaxID=2738125 RepID=A0ABY9G8P8_9PSED|nr:MULTISPECIES: hypothetical protein [unclassified Pseudomonas]WLH12012.1 hypothetical protein PSH57_24775 [Pseudomonas sp. FP205]WLH95067.1 hypothetical protein PSH58_24790 [Pseudomonas sp. FP53]WLI39355.1 hypothetical protein PSH74_24790 [Pseudomonas sp. FP821]
MDRDQSFNATLRMFDRHVNLLEILHGKPAMATVSLFSGGFFTGRPQTHDHSSLLGMRPKGQNLSATPLKLHFRHTNDGYSLVIKNTGEHDNKLIGKRWLEVLGAQDSGTDDPMFFTLVDHQNNAITLKNIFTPHLPVSLMTENKKHIGGLKVRGSPYIYLAETEEKSKVTFILSVL